MTNRQAGSNTGRKFLPWDFESCPAKTNPAVPCEPRVLWTWNDASVLRLLSLVREHRLRKTAVRTEYIQASCYSVLRLTLFGVAVFCPLLLVPLLVLVLGFGVLFKRLVLGAVVRGA